MATRKRTGVGYARYSRLGKRDAESLRTLDVQGERNEDVASDNGIELVASFEDHAKSGGSLNGRDGLASALGMIEHGDAKVLVAARLSRLARSVVDLHDIVKRVDKAGGSIVLGDLGRIDTKSAPGKMMLTVLGAVAEFELDLAREHSHTARRDAIEEGCYIGARVPWGYKRPAKSLEVDPVRGPVMREVFERRASGATWKELTDYVQQTTGDFLPASTLQKMIANRTYLGSVRSGELVKDGAHDPLVDVETFEAAQSTPRLRKSRHGSLLAGLLTCSGCGRPMTFRIQRQPGGKTFATYACQRQSKAGRCPAPVTVSATLADDAVSQSFVEWAKTQALVEGDPRDADELAQADAALAEAELDLRTWLKTVPVLARSMDEAELEAEGAEVQSRVDAARERVAALRSERRLDRVRFDVAEKWDELDVEQRRQLIAGALDRIVVRKAASRAKGVSFTERADVIWRDA